MKTSPSHPELTHSNEPVAGNKRINGEEFLGHRHQDVTGGPRIKAQMR